ncbi:NAD(P)/FAD-dependent oxidoreductase [Jannaschia pohangensis]|uniref:Sarcosine oxidase n=1 Tax=Jannaschia pohangensis TaxID=390807 RepID=A0A1I3MBD3_9RHOB|nr:FAD-dependent oxidoreductase [Jannaschia pohangensis]SFI94055.1 sarcosine oxidase [Jannaschia pohangensis]
MERFDFVVIGGGMMGAPCARHLAEAGHRVALVAAPEPAVKAEWQGPFGSHFDAARITRQVAADPDWALLSQRSIARYGDLEARSGQTIFREVGALMAGPTDGPLAGFTEGFLAVAQSVEGAEILSAGDIWEALGLALPDESEVCLERRGGGWIDPRAMRHAQVMLAAHAGARIVPQAAVARNGDVVALADGERIGGDEIVVATGPHAGSDGLLPLVPSMKVWARTIALARISETMARRLAGMPSVIWVPEGWDHDLYLLPPVRYPDGHLYLKIGGQLDSPRIHSAADMRDWFHGTGDAAVGARLMTQMRELMPDLKVQATHTEPCAVVWTDTGFPYVARVAEGLTVLTGGNGAAAKCGDELGRLGAMVARGQDISGEGYATDFRAVWVP